MPEIVDYHYEGSLRDDPRRRMTQFFSSFGRRRTFNLLATIAIAIILPVTFFAVQKSQELRQRANVAGNFEVARVGIPSGSRITQGVDTTTGESFMQFAPDLIPSAGVYSPGTHLGWDYNLTKKCVSTIDPSGVNGFRDTQQCGADGKVWTVAVESEKAGQYGISCPGPASQSFPINVPGSPMQMNWTPHVDEQGRTNWKVNMITDFLNVTHPCQGASYYTWFVLMDNTGPMPVAGKTVLKVRLRFKKEQRGGDNSTNRVFVSMGTHVEGGNPIRNYAIDINLYKNGWVVQNPNDPLVSDTIIYDGGVSKGVGINPAAVGASLSYDQEQDFTIDFGDLLTRLSQRGVFPNIDWNTVWTDNINIGTELGNNAPTNTLKTDLEITNYRIESK